jgi:purine-nucleoside/S-methyl-5'-thioadenosine phosphorylase / adenosine deaminase
MKNPSIITFPIFDGYPELFCVFSTRIGGFSENEYSTMNMGLTCGDNINTVKKNRKLWFDTLNIDENKLAIPKQIHSEFVKKVIKPGIYEDTDGLCTENQNIILTIQTADCLPVFIYEPEKKIIAVVHAGWQGALKGIILKALDKLENDHLIENSKLKIAIGPGIQSTCFEVREDVYSKFPLEFLSMHEDPKKKYLDLQLFIKNQFMRQGVSEKNLFIDSTCTHCDNKRYYSYRRDKNHSGRMMGILSFKNALNT